VWFDANDPFSQTDGRLYSLSSGLTATDGDGINCDMAEELGCKIHAQMDNAGFMDVVLRKKDQMKTLMRLQKSVVSEHKEIFMHTTHLFNRLIVLVERSLDTEQYFCYELTPLPASLFKDSLMRKPDKAVLGRLITSESIVVDPIVPTVYVIDGGCLLHRVKWPKVGLYGDVLDLYRRYVLKHFGNGCVVVFDGYNSGPTTKDHEHFRRSVMSAPNIQVTELHQVHLNQTAFLSNGNNKSQFIKLLSKHPTDDGHIVTQATGDADTDIAKAAIDIAASGKAVTVVADDTDVLVLLVHHLTQLCLIFTCCHPVRLVRTGQENL